MCDVSAEIVEHLSVLIDALNADLCVYDVEIAEEVQDEHFEVVAASDLSVGVMFLRELSTLLSVYL